MASATVAVQGRPAEAVELLQRALKIAPEYAEGHNTFALACEALGRKDDAKALLEEARRMDPKGAHPMAPVLKRMWVANFEPA